MWPLILVLFSGLVTKTATLTPQPPYFYPPVAHNFDDAEKKDVPEWVMKTDADYQMEREYQTFMVFNFAGRAQFPALIRVENVKTSRHSVGNLILPKFVLTSCRAVLDIYIEGDVKNEAKSTPAKAVSNLELLTRYCSAYLEEINKFRASNGTMIVESPVYSRGAARSIGAIYVKNVHISEKCDGVQWITEFAVLELKHNLDPTRSWINYMTVPMDKGGKVIHINLSNMEKDRTLCYVGSFGGHYANVKDDDNKLLLRKTSFRAYKIDLNQCATQDFACANETTQLICRFPGKQELEKDGVECYETRAKVGAVCDHDRGGPLVCNGLTQGIVIRGSRKARCNNMYPLPFLVQRVFHLLPFITDLTNKGILTPRNPLDNPENCKVRTANCGGKVTERRMPFPTLFQATESSSHPVKGSIFVILTCIAILQIHL